MENSKPLFHLKDSIESQLKQMEQCMEKEWFEHVTIFQNRSKQRTQTIYQQVEKDLQTLVEQNDQEWQQLEQEYHSKWHLNKKNLLQHIQEEIDMAINDMNTMIQKREEEKKQNFLAIGQAFFGQNFMIPTSTGVLSSQQQDQLPSPLTTTPVPASIRSQQQQQQPSTKRPRVMVSSTTSNRSGSRHEMEDTHPCRIVSISGQERGGTTSEVDTNGNVQDEHIILQLQKKQCQYPARQIWYLSHEISEWFAKERDFAEEIFQDLHAFWNPLMFQRTNFYLTPISKAEIKQRREEKAKAVRCRNSLVNKMIIKWGFKKTLGILTPESTKGQFWFGFGTTELKKMSLEELDEHLQEYTSTIPTASIQQHAMNVLELIEMMNGNSIDSKMLSMEARRKIVLEDQVPCEDPVLELVWQKKRLTEPWHAFLNGPWAQRQRLQHAS